MTEHDPKGKTKLKLPEGVVGLARFAGPGNCYRPWLSRHIERPDAAYALWIGMNPSTAGAEVDDPTCRREWAYTTDRLGLQRYVKCNVMDYRATDPKDLLRASVPVRSDENLNTIRLAGRHAKKVIFCCGKLPKQLVKFAEDAHAVLKKEGVEVWCLGKNGDGSPKHPLYIPHSADLVLF